MHIYFAGLGGIAIGPLALLARDLGWTVNGSDSTLSRYTRLLADQGVEVSPDQSGEYLRSVHAEHPVDWYVYTAALPDDHPELLAARELGLKASKRDVLVNFIVKEKGLQLIAVSGTHGKTTTTAMLVWLFDRMKIPFAHLVGTNLSFAPSGRYQARARYFVYEADEYDRNMLRFRPTLSVIPALDYDHSDTYKTKRDYLEAFRRFVAQSAHTVLWQSDAGRLGLSAGADLTVVPGDRDFSRIRLPGQHNRANAWLAITAAGRIVGEKVGWEELCRLISDFPGSERRFEKLAEGLYSDYAHHPAEIRATLQLAREVAGKRRVIAVYQPHQNVRQHEIADQYGDCFAGADQLYWLPTYLSREDKKLKVLQPAELLAKLAKHPPAEAAEPDKKLAEKIRKHLSDDDLLLLMTAGDADDWLRQHFGQN
jgi:UDP-N-acetylmuramate--alanine ligase